MSDFKCPKCGGWAFGTTLREDAESEWGYRIVSYNCDSDRTGTALSMTNEEFEAGILCPKRDKPCGWRGKEFPSA